ncbi:uncharacterized protein F4807DRAFT_460668 [Annulohypoxylon truncatum]|uniref:uncharacterized protein n=1 Tax=Annulohypoxylon truncatum TaxID=327061 RepID=UPI002008CC46|nr:uncharacterized protein F4807DRAFT_460668 [Annulohypoxylon truncatum]KAI1209453.1 hypothetical protein F4807DRAFT_460668 [Annulohypoxylon truncatum]
MDAPKDADTWLYSSTVDVLEGVAARLRSLAPPSTKVLAQGADITDEASVAALFAAAKEAVGKVDVLINSAGSLDLGALGTVDATKFFNDFQVNVLGSMTTGAIGNVFPGMAGYTASKLAVVRMVENLHAGQPGIRVFMLIPGIDQTEMTVDMLKPYAKDSPGLSGGRTLFLSTPRAEWMRGGIVSVNYKSPFQYSKIATLLAWDGVVRGYRGDGGA